MAITQEQFYKIPTESIDQYHARIAPDAHGAGFGGGEEVFEGIDRAFEEIVILHDAAVAIHEIAVEIEEGEELQR